jgi:hypothetical protein
MHWLCRCDCGTEKLVFIGNLTTGRSKSCGCLRQEISTANTTWRTHGKTKHPLHGMWKGIRGRCNDQNLPSYKNYGGRGIRVCDRWADFEKFLEDMEPTWSPGLTLERKDNNGHYEPNNCCWIPKQDQSANRRCVKPIDTPWGRMNIRQAAIRAGLKHQTLWGRIKSGWPKDRWFEQMKPKKVTLSDEQLIAELYRRGYTDRYRKKGK